MTERIQWTILQHLIDDGPGLMCIKDEDRRYLYANAPFITTFGFNPATSDLVRDEDLFPPATAARLVAHDTMVQTLGIPRFDEETIPAGGQDKLFFVRRFLIAGENGRSLLGIIAFEGGRAGASPQLLASSALFKGILDIAVDAIISIDEDQRIILFNQGAERIFGYESAEVVGGPLAVLLPKSAWDVHQHHIQRFGRSGGAARPMGERSAIFGQRKDGTIFPAEASISRIQIEGRTTYTAILRDITERRTAEAAIALLNEDLKHRAVQLENANRELEAFSYSVSHDLRAPLRSIDGFSQVLLEDFDASLSADAQDSLRRIRGASQRMSQLIDDMLSLSRLTRGNVAREDLTLSTLAAEIVTEMQARDPERQAHITIAPDVRGNADPHLLQAVLNNLLENAWKFTSKRDLARIEFGQTTDARGRTVYFVRDNGAGFDMTYVGKLFGAFQRLHAHDEYAGTGVGLATVQRIIHKHGGEVWAEGAVDQGATFYFTLG